MENEFYLQKQKEKQEAYEALCIRCGACCGALDGDACLNLATDSNNKYYCKIYENRFGKQSTVSGKTFHCIPIRLLRGTGTTFANCAYFK
jgi:uncharacterized cysteine cluster protein YcgN (CxxCxxCC family)